jgi:tetratricopeptide (TPR) repeat protein
MNPTAKNGTAASTEDAKTRKWNWLGGDEATQLRSELKEGNLAGLREYLARSLCERDWQDRDFMLALVIPELRLEALSFAEELEPEAADLALVRCAYFVRRAWQMRGNGTTDKVGEIGFEAAANCVKSAIESLYKAKDLNPSDPTPHAYILPALMIFTGLAEVFQAAFSRVEELAPNHVPAHYTMVNTLSKRWGGSHELSLEFAREAVRRAPLGSDMPVCLFWAHSLVRTHLEGFDNNPEAAEEYARKKEIRAELEEAFDRWTQPSYQPRRSSALYLHQAAAWFYRVLDRERLRRSLSLLGDTYASGPWTIFGNARKAHAAAIRFAFERPAEQAVEQDPCEECFTFAVHGARSPARGELEIAEKNLITAMRFAQSAEPDQGALLVSMIELHQSMLRRKQGRNDEAAKLREFAVQQIEGMNGQIVPAKIYRRIAAVLMEMNELRLAIPFFEQAIQTASEDTKATVNAEMLQSLGECYCRIGLPDHGAIPLRSALRIFRQYPGDPRMLGTLLTLGNSLRKTSTAEAEALFNEAAELCTAKLQIESATSAWMNLGILCSEQGRYDESLAHYQRVLRVRQQTAGTAPAQIARVLNNIANCYRRMRKFAEAQESADQALRILAPDDPVLAFVYGTKGRAFLEAGDDVQAVEWLRKTRIERDRQPGANLQATVEDLEGEITALDRLGRHAEANEARTALASVRTTMDRMVQNSGDVQPNLHAPTEGVVFVELASGCYARKGDGPDQLYLLAVRLSKQVRDEAAGRYAGAVAVPENITLIFYGQDAEKLFAVLEPLLREEQLCTGAIVTVQQQATKRKILMRGEFVRVN